MEAISKLLREIDPPLTGHDVFYDLGAGRGIVPALATLEFFVKRSVGVELSKTRVEIGCEGLQVLRGYLSRSMQGIPHRHLELVYGSMLDIKMDDATVVYMCATVIRSRRALKGPIFC